MDLHDLESEVQRLVGYDLFVTSGLADKGPFINVNGKRQLLRIWIPRTGAEPERVAELVKTHFADPSRPGYQEITY